MSNSVISTLKVRFTSDSSKLKKDMDDNTRAMKEMKTKGGDAINELGRMVGVDVDRMTNSLRSFSETTKILGKGFKVSAAGSGLLSGALKVLKLALVSTGIGAIVVALGSLIAYFKGSERGADKLSVWLKKLGAVVTVIKDRLVLFGEGLVLLFEGKWGEAAEKMKESFVDIGKEMKEDAILAGELEQRDLALQDREIKLIKVMGARKRKIEELRKAAEDETYSLVQRQKALAEAMKLEKQNAADEISMQAERVDIMQQRLNMDESSREDRKELAEAEDRLNQIQAQSDRTLKRLLTRYNSLTHEITAAEQATLKLAKANNKYLLPSMKMKIGKDFDLTSLATTLKGGTVAVENSGKAIKKSLSDADKAINASLASTSIQFGQFVGSLMIGAASMQDLGPLLLGGLADTMMKLGEMAILTAIGIEAIKEALSTLNPWVALAAGVALVTFATLIKGSIKNLGSNIGSGSGGSSIPAITGPRTNVIPGTASLPPPPTEQHVIRIIGKIAGRDIYLANKGESDRLNLST